MATGGWRCSAMAVEVTVSQGPCSLRATSLDRAPVAAVGAYCGGCGPALGRAAGRRRPCWIRAAWLAWLSPTVAGGRRCTAIAVTRTASQLPRGLGPALLGLAHAPAVACIACCEGGGLAYVCTARP